MLMQLAVLWSVSVAHKYYIYFFITMFGFVFQALCILGIRFAFLTSAYLFSKLFFFKKNLSGTIDKSHYY